MGTKANILALLEGHRGSWISGEELAGRLGVSRASVWKAVETLRKEGLEVDSLPGGGYKLPQSSDLLSEESLRIYMGQDGYAFKVEKEVPSTNLAAKQWAIEGAPHGALVVAGRQTAGRGRLGRAFESPPGGLYMSAVLRPQKLENPALITAAAAVAACQAVEHLCGKQLAIKWVNDLYYQGKKCCGILTEAGTGFENGSIEYIVVGLGINYTTPQASFAPGVQEIATSLYPEGEAPAPRARLAAEVYRRLLQVFEVLPQKTFLEEYRRRSMVIGREVMVMAEPPYPAKAVAINNEAHLVVERADGQCCTLSSGEISIKVKG